MEIEAGRTGNYEGKSIDNNNIDELGEDPDPLREAHGQDIE